MNGSTVLTILMVARLRRTKTPLLIWRRRRSCMIFLHLGESLLILKVKSDTPMLVSHMEIEKRSTPNCKLYYLPSGSDNKRDLCFGRKEEMSFSLGSSLGIDQLLVFFFVLSGVLLSTFEGSFPSSSTIFLELFALGLAGCEQFRISSLLLQNILWDTLCPKTKHAR